MTAAVVLTLSVLTLVVLGALLATMRSGRSQAPPPGVTPGTEPEYFDPRTIKVTDTVHCAGVRFRAIGALHLSRQGERRTEYLLDDGNRRYQWLSVEERREPGADGAGHLEVLLWTTVPTDGMVPAKSTLMVEGAEFSPVRRATVAFRAEGTTGLPDRGLLDSALYRAGDGRLLAFRRVQGGSWSASYAHPLPPGSIRVERLS
ncbi:DUF4178 domain-containing protein [Microtetraspora sp. NBRC 16547]|uniref:DUF4178 domain-containing protein n=1 Tax=Microtetraspora sp. NBRC 16547 TaxID=3030993 RepID=UPI0024A43DC4|nr:DUF4178 domain-containing protein [Microtetraspora sp. NBRC 16547]GLW97721.1 hypothetical protein Misp02_18080 [Microtetraspora sp. NBRC 16547]